MHRGTRVARERPRRRDLSERLAVVGHVGEHDQDVHVLLVGKELGGRERHARRDDPLGRRVGGEVHEDDGALSAPVDSNSFKKKLASSS